MFHQRRFNSGINIAVPGVAERAFLYYLVFERSAPAHVFIHKRSFVSGGGTDFNPLLGSAELSVDHVPARVSVSRPFQHDLEWVRFHFRGKLDSEVPWLEFLRVTDCSGKQRE